MDKSFYEIKKEVSSKFLGKEGIHAIGMSRSQNPLKIYIEANWGLPKKNILEEIISEATPFKILIIEDKKSTIT